ncbi:AzlD family protein [Polymorphum gilvum]|uniref:AzlD family protein n=1 Tax=Polymorphum gilvum TaxID=991904 RepID=UPI00059B9098|nr:AzlD domain-containing protein [Polymorphum gilvum]
MTEGLFSADALFVAAVLAMAAVTYSLRAGGYFVMGRVPLTDRVRRGLESLPGAIIVSTILPIALKGGLPAALCLAATALVMGLVRKDVLAVAVGIAVAAAARAGGL